MATKHLCLLLLLTLLSSTHIHARDSQMFNKIPSKVNENVVKETQQLPNKQEDSPLNTNEQQEPNFTPQNENSYGLYGHESGQFPPSTTTTTQNNFEPSKGSNFPYNAKYLPKNYNPVAYVTEPEDFNDSSSFEEKSTENRDLNNNNNNFYNGGMKDSEFMDREYINTENRNNYFNGANNYNLQQNNLNNNNNNNYNLQQNNLNNNNNNNNNYYNGGRINRVQPQGMSDTRFMENGKYYYDVNAGRHSRDPVETAKEFALRNQYNTRGYYGNNNNNENSYQYNNNNNENSYQYNNNYNEGREQYHDEDDMP